ncbi:hypothetical protein NQ317_010085 [Molorchus minor]|uniref:Uncharacterized protein n=1 Tax=Molorchus minor TaxID=1323400 RepID=A0ABQ9JIB1_9CUCU|nr:hypothetical protein NQ317_010085 [Molorchus minor]
MRKLKSSLRFFFLMKKYFMFIQFILASRHMSLFSFGISTLNLIPIIFHIKSKLISFLWNAQVRCIYTTGLNLEYLLFLVIVCGLVCLTKAECDFFSTFYGCYIFIGNAQVINILFYLDNYNALNLVAKLHHILIRLDFRQCFLIMVHLYDKNLHAKINV